MLHANNAPRTPAVGHSSAELRALLSKNTKPNEVIIPAEAIARAAMVSCRRAFALARPAQSECWNHSPAGGPLSPMSAIGTDRLCLPVCEHFRCSRLTGSIPDGRSFSV